MPTITWPKTPGDIVAAFEQRRPNRGDTGALMMWATFTVEGIYYLSDLDDAYRAGSVSSLGHQPETIEISHIRWAAGTAITALDLCAAALGREFCECNGPHEYSLRNF